MTVASPNIGTMLLPETVFTEIRADRLTVEQNFLPRSCLRELEVSMPCCLRVRAVLFAGPSSRDDGNTKFAVFCMHRSQHLA